MDKTNQVNIFTIENIYVYEHSPKIRMMSEISEI